MSNKKSTPKTKTLTIKLNGTEENPYHKYGLTRNPFPQIGKYEWSHVDHLLANLEAEPIKDDLDLRDRLKGCDPDFIQVCCERFQKGKMVVFELTFPEGPWYSGK